MITSTTKIYALIGDPVEHSVSPLMHNRCFKELKLNCVYVAFRVRKEFLKEAMLGIKYLGISGANITIPHKVEVMKYLDEIDEVAKAIGAVNTVVNKNGRLIGYNTDGIGAVRSLKEVVKDLRGKKVTLIGAGGAARAISFCLLKEGACLRIVNRTYEKAVELAELLSQTCAVRPEVYKLDENELGKALEDSEILINSTSVGMYPLADKSPVPQKLLRSDLIVFDIVYNPLKTKLLREAEEVGATTIEGYNMLVYQAVESFKLWTGIEPPVELMKQTVLEHLK